MSTIRETVSANLRSDYLSYAEPVINVLQEREQGIADNLRAFANEKGLSEREVDALFIEVGLMQQPVEPEAVAEVEDADPIARLERAVAALADRFETLVSAAARHGVTV